MKEYPSGILASLREFPEKEQPPSVLRGWSLVLSGWLMRLGHLESEARISMLRSELSADETLASVFHEARKDPEMSVSAAEKYAKMSPAYLAARKEQIEWEGRFHQYNRYYDATKEASQTVKKALDTSIQEARLIGGMP
jgi:hypothetical protein